MAEFFDQLGSLLFLDIETASTTESFESLDPRLQQEWIRKEKYMRSENPDPEPGSFFFDRAGIHAEFGKIICIGVGYFQVKKRDKKLLFRSKIFASEEEKEILMEMKALLERKKWILCAHNGKEFDFPYLCRRMLIHGISLPEPLQLAGKKPWELRHVDTMDLWKFGDYKHYTRLELLAGVFGITSSKESIDGSEVNASYYQEKNIEKIKAYCLRDVEVTARIYLALHPQQDPFEVVLVDD
ncbi:MAG: 3'-5' exonuclease [Algoriphagus sp.]|jgi:DNA polymerase elongation subunit (family B)|nr:3'-5' exonuclease [Algoriphagus sp.]